MSLFGFLLRISLQVTLAVNTNNITAKLYRFIKLLTF